METHGLPIPGHGLPKWAPLAAGGLVVAFLVLRAKSATTAASPSTSPAADPLAAAAQQLQTAATQQQITQQGALSALATQVAGAQQQYQAGYGFLTAGGTKGNNPLVGCPGGGEARFVPNPGSPLGWSWECIPKSQSSGGFVAQLIGTAQQAFNDFLSVSSGGAVKPPAGGSSGGSSGGSYTPKTTGDTTGGYPPGYVATTV